MENKPTQRELVATPEDQVMAQKIVAEELGEGFKVDYTSLPKNVGVIGDEGVRGPLIADYGRNAGTKPVSSRKRRASGTAFCQVVQ